MITSGSRLGPYEIVSKIGAGGMGEVYRARDTRLDRTVAVKILPSELAGDSRLKIRFEREAKIISQFNHPNICSLYDVGENYLVMEYLEGETLADRIARGPMPLGDVLKYGAQIAEALNKGHQSGVIHRDVKPGNVMLTKSGAKLLDFGIAKATVAQTVEDDATLRKPLTSEGSILGTFNYMAPEQLEGREADARTDIFALGALLYEMTTGKRAFQGTTHTSVIAAIVSGQPEPMSALAPIAPPVLEHIVQKCLEKDPADRWHSAHDIAEQLRWISEAGTNASITAPFHVDTAAAAHERRLVMPLAVTLAALIVGSVGGVLAWRWRHPVTIPPVARTSISLADAGLSLRGSGMLMGGGIAISPDGQTVAFAAQGAGQSRLYVRRIDDWETRPLPNTEEGVQPFFSPDGKWLGFFVANKGLYKVSLRGGAPQLLHKGTGGDFGATWRTDDKIILANAEGMRAGLWSVNADGGGSEKIPSSFSADQATFYNSPELLPNNRTVIFTILRDGASSIAAIDLKTGKIRTVVESGSQPRYVASGYLTYVAENRLYAVPFDAERLATGPGRVVVDPVDAQYDVSRTGTLVYVDPTGAPARLVWKDRSGGTSPLRFDPRPYSSPALSPDGRAISVTLPAGSGGLNVWSGSVDGEPLGRLTFGTFDQFSIYSPDGKWVLFTSGSRGRYNIFRAAADGSGTVERLTDSPHGQCATSFSPQGDLLLFNEISAANDFDIMQRDMKTGAVKPFLKTPFSELNAVFSPDGRWVAYTSEESGQPQVYVRPYPGPATKKQISINGGTWSAWNQRGGELFYQAPDAVMAVRLVDGSPAAAPQPVFSHSAAFRYSQEWTASPDGSRFLVVESAESVAAPTHIRVISNWFQELEKEAGKKQE